MLEKYQLTQYQMHLDGFEPEQQNRTELEKILFEFPSLIRNNKAVQAISGTGLGLILVILVMILVCCLCSARCRGCARQMCCCCCSVQEAKEVVDGLRDRINQERENFQEYQLIRKEARNPGRSAPAFEHYRDRLTQQMSRREQARAPTDISEA